jgi:hypothetical protein
VALPDPVWALPLDVFPDAGAAVVLVEPDPLVSVVWAPAACAPAKSINTITAPANSSPKTTVRWVLPVSISLVTNFTSFRFFS